MSKVPIISPVNPKLLDHIQQPKTLSSNPSARPLGNLPETIDFSNYQVKREKSGDVSVKSFPTSFDLRNETPSGVTPVKDQGAFGSCWAFGNCSGLEGYVQRIYGGKTKDFSEKHMVDYNGWEFDENSGGNTFAVAAYLFGWRGPINEADSPYPTGAWGPPISQPWTRQINPYDLRVIPQKTSAMDNDLIKEYLQNYGPVVFSMMWDDIYYNGTTESYYYPNSTPITNGGHCVSVVGWDDNYSRFNFNTTPPTDGAFLIKNSWGTSWGEQGFFWISYHDGYAGKETPSFGYQTYNTTPYDHIYQHDLNGWVNSFGYSGIDSWGGKIFQTESNPNPLAGITLVTTQANQEVEIFLYTDPTNGNPSSGQLQHNSLKSFEYAGYHTILLPHISLDGINQFSIVARYVYAGDQFTVPLEATIADIVTRSPISANQSFYSDDGSSWNDFNDDVEKYHVNIKAFSQIIPPTINSPIISNSLKTPIMLDGNKKTVIKNNLIL